MKQLTFLISFTLSSSFLFAQNSKAMSYLALGDSYTICESIEVESQWPKQLVAFLNLKGLMVKAPNIIAKTGWRTDNLMRAAENQTVTNKYDLVSLLIGVNNEFQGWTAADFKPEFEKCVKFAIEHCNNGAKGVFILSIPDYGYTPFGKSKQKSISSRIDEFNAVCKEVTLENNIAYYDITAISREGLKNANYVAKDGLHPSAEQYKAWITKYGGEIAAQIKAL